MVKNSNLSQMWDIRCTVCNLTAKIKNCLAEESFNLHPSSIFPGILLSLTSLTWLENFQLCLKVCPFIQQKALSILYFLSSSMIYLVNSHIVLIYIYHSFLYYFAASELSGIFTFRTGWLIWWYPERITSKFIKNFFVSIIPQTFRRFSRQLNFIFASQSFHAPNENFHIYSTRSLYAWIKFKRQKNFIHY